jgi:hypothetical protein
MMMLLESKRDPHGVPGFTGYGSFGCGFGQHGTNEMIYLVGLYSMVSTTLNGFNVPVPERE